MVCAQRLGHKKQPKGFWWTSRKFHLAHRYLGFPPDITERNLNKAQGDGQPFTQDRSDDWMSASARMEGTRFDNDILAGALSAYIVWKYIHGSFSASIIFWIIDVLNSGRFVHTLANCLLTAGQLMLTLSCYSNESSGRIFRSRGSHRNGNHWGDDALLTAQLQSSPISLSSSLLAFLAFGNGIES